MDTFTDNIVKLRCVEMYTAKNIVDYLVPIKYKTIEAHALISRLKLAFLLADDCASF